MNIHKGVIVLAIGVAFLYVNVIPVHAQFDPESNILFQSIPNFQFSNDELVERLSPDVDLDFRLQVISEEVTEFFTFDPVEKAELKLEHAKDKQEQINDLDSRGLAIPIEIEERRIQKINEATEILNQKFEEDGVIQDTENGLFDTFESLREMGELNDIRVLYSQLPSVINADEETKRQYNARVNALETWQNNCIGEFDVDEMVPLSEAVDKLEMQCPRLVELQEKFGYERIKLLVTGSV